MIAIFGDIPDLDSHLGSWHDIDLM